MNKIKNLVLISFLMFSFFNVSKAENLAEKYAPIANKIFEAVHKDTLAWERLAYMCDTFGPRLTGSEGLERSLVWLEELMNELDLKNVTKQKLLATHWVRNEEKLTLLEPHKRDLILLSLGGSVGTPKEGITGEVIVVKNYEELREKRELVKGKIVLFDLDWEGYGKNIQYRLFGADSASKFGALASMIRSVSNHGYQLPHTGVMFYSGEYKKIPHIAITLEESMMMKRLYDRGQKIVVHLYSEAQTLPDVETYNLWAELPGLEYPEKYIAIGGHIDSWDVGTGAMDDASGVFAGIEAINLLQELNLIPKHTIRAVAWANEENGSKGGKKYAEENDSASHVLMLEFDSGVYKPKAIGFTGPDDMYDKLKEVESLFKIVNPEFEFRKGGGGVDIRPMMDKGVPGMGMWGDSNNMYFIDHHSPTDMPDKVDAKVFNDCIAVMALTIYIYSDIQTN
jgi:carboxypeptidase Q